MATLGKEQWTIVKSVFRYLCGTIHFAICYHGNYEEVRFHGFIDSDWDGDIDGRQETIQYVFTLFGGAISWMRRKQFVVSLSTIEAEYIAATHASKGAVWLQQICSEIGLGQQVVRLNCDSQSAIFLEKNPAYHSNTKHIDVYYHFVREMREKGKFLLDTINTIENVVYLLTKLVSTKDFTWCRNEMGLTSLTN